MNIYRKFKTSNVKIKSQAKLQAYITYCMENNQKEKICNDLGYSKTSYHHILPKALFSEYSDLKIYNWNGVYLLHRDHYYAHWLLTEAISDYGQLVAFCAMHNKDKKLKRINEEDLISPIVFQNKLEEKSKKHSEYLKGAIASKAAYKGHKTREIKKECGKTGKEIFSETRSKTINSKYYINVTLPNMMDKRNKTMSVKNIDGFTGFELSNIKSVKTKRDKNPLYDILYKGEIIHHSLNKKEIKELNAGLLNTNEDNKLGTSIQQKNKLNQYNKLNMVGWYLSPI